MAHHSRAAFSDFLTLRPCFKKVRFPCGRWAKIMHNMSVYTQKCFHVDGPSRCLTARVSPTRSNSYYRTGEAAFFPLSQIPRLSFANKQLCCFGPWTVWIIRWCGKGEDKYTVPPETQTVWWMNEWMADGRFREAMRLKKKKMRKEMEKSGWMDVLITEIHQIDSV